MSVPLAPPQPNPGAPPADPGLARRIADMLRQADFFRRSPSRLGGPAQHKEWQHFMLHGDEVHLLVNFSLVDDPFARDRRRGEVARLIVLARGDAWDGDVDRFEPEEVEVQAGGMDARFGDNRMSFRDGRFHLRVALRERPIAAELTMTPTIVPTLSSNQPLSRTRNISWLFVPRLAVEGTVTLDGRTLEVRDGPGYHDHNWGHFLWDDDFSWEWGSALPPDPANPWSVVYMRMADRGRSLCRSQALYIGCGGEQFRFFRDHDLRVTLHGRFDAGRCLKVPRIMAMLAPGTAADLPRRLEVDAAAGGDRVRMVFAPEDVAQLVLPSETRLDAVTIINEVSGRVSLEGSVRGRRVEMEGPGVFEFIRD